MSSAADTTPEAAAVQLDAYRRMGGLGRNQAMFRLGEMARRAAEAGIRQRHPEYDDQPFMLVRARHLYGDEIVRQAWPQGPLVEPWPWRRTRSSRSPGSWGVSTSRTW